MAVWAAAPATVIKVAASEATVRANTVSPSRGPDWVDCRPQPRCAVLRQYSRAQVLKGVMTFGRAAVPHITIDFDKFTCNLKSGHNAALSRRFLAWALLRCAVLGRQRAQGSRVPAVSLTVSRPAMPFAPMRSTSTTAHPTFRDDRDTLSDRDEVAPVYCKSEIR